MIKIVKQGETIFKMVCPQCNCIYTYEIGDILTGGTYCPCCDEFNLHSARIKSDTVLNVVDFSTGKIEWQKSIDDSISSIDRTQLSNEIRKHDNTIDNKKYLTACHKCGCKFWFTKGDYKGNDGEGVSISCPQCGHTLSAKYIGNIADMVV